MATEPLPSNERVHELKCWPEFFRHIADRSKSFECRWNDRRYKIGDMLHIREFDPDKETYTGAEAWRRVTYILRGTPGARFGLNDGWAILGLSHETAESPLCDGEIRLIYEHGEPKGVRDTSGFLCFFNHVTKYEGQEERYRRELALRARQAEVIADALRRAENGSESQT